MPKILILTAEIFPTAKEPDSGPDGRVIEIRPGDPECFCPETTEAILQAIKGVVKENSISHIILASRSTAALH